MTLRIAMWSGPRNISTAMMRSFSSRPDTAVSDEPFYGCFLEQTGLDHPMRDAIVADMDCDWWTVAVTLSEGAPEDKPVWYQKHMSHHMVGPVVPDDLPGFTHAFLIRDPARMVASYAAKRESVCPDDLGLARQRAFFERECDRLGKAPAVVDSADVLRDPAGTLSALCDALGIGWTDAMLHWPAGRHAADGIWAPHWYGRVEASTGFEGAEGAPPALDADLRAVAEACMADYQAMAVHAVGRGRE